MAKNWNNEERDKVILTFRASASRKVHLDTSLLCRRSTISFVQFESEISRDQLKSAWWISKAGTKVYRMGNVWRTPACPRWCSTLGHHGDDSSSRDVACAIKLVESETRLVTSMMMIGRFADDRGGDVSMLQRRSWREDPLLFSPPRRSRGIWRITSACLDAHACWAKSWLRWLFATTKCVSHVHERAGALRPRRLSPGAMNQFYRKTRAAEHARHKRFALRVGVMKTSCRDDC